MCICCNAPPKLSRAPSHRLSASMPNVPTPHPTAPCSFLFHYAIGAQLARFVRLSNKLAPASPAAFLGSFVLSSTVLWQCLDAML